MIFTEIEQEGFSVYLLWLLRSDFVWGVGGTANSRCKDKMGDKKRAASKLLGKEQSGDIMETFPIAFLLFFPFCCNEVWSVLPALRDPDFPLPPPLSQRR